MRKFMHDDPSKYEHVYIKVRRVPLRMYSTSESGRYEARIVGFRGFNQGGWDTLGTTRGHATKDDAIDAIGKLAARRGIKVTDDPRALRMLEFRDRYGDGD
jgi:hypothetical protein